MPLCAATDAVVVATAQIKEGERVEGERLREGESMCRVREIEGFVGSLLLPTTA